MIEGIFSRLPAFPLSTAKAALLATLRFITAPALFVVQKVTFLAKPVSPQMAAISALLWAITTIAIVLFSSQKKPQANPPGPNKAQQQHQRMIVQRAAVRAAALAARPNQLPQPANDQYLKEIEEISKKYGVKFPEFQMLNDQVGDMLIQIPGRKREEEESPVVASLYQLREKVGAEHYEAGSKCLFGPQTAEDEVRLREVYSLANYLEICLDIASKRRC